jgi:hypothetical protein
MSVAICGLAVSACRFCSCELYLLRVQIGVSIEADVRVLNQIRTRNEATRK